MLTSFMIICMCRLLPRTVILLRTLILWIAFGAICRPCAAEFFSDPGDRPVFTSLETALESPEEVYALDLKFQELDSIPADIGRLTNLEYLEIGYNPFTELPPDIGRLTHLKVLDIRCSWLRRVPDALGELANLEVLAIGGNMDCELRVDGKLEVIDPVPAIANIEIIGRLRNLQALAIMFLDGFREFPIFVCDLPHLRHLTIDSTDLAALPPEIGCLSALTTLSLWNNRLESIPPEIGQLTQLERLLLIENRLTTLPEEIVNLRKLKYLYLDNDTDSGLNNNFSPEERQRIRQLLPNTNIRF